MNKNQSVPEGAKSVFKNRRVVCMLVIGLLLIIPVKMWVNHLINEPVTVRPSTLSVGEEGRLDIGGSKILVATTKANFDESIKLSVAKDNMGLANLALSGGAFLVDSGTKVHVIDMMTGARQVRIMDGQFIGQSGWVPMEFVKK